MRSPVARSGRAARRFMASPPVDDLVDSASLLVAIALATTLHIGGPGGVRVALVLLFTVFVPGRALVVHVPPLMERAGLELSIVVSLAVLALVATVTLWAHYWHPVGTAEIEAVGAAILLVTGLVRRTRSSAEPAAAETGPG